MKRLFSVTHDNDISFFDSKKAAKEFRGTGHVSIGPDHWRYDMRGNPRTHSHTARSGGPGTGFPKKTK